MVYQLIISCQTYLIPTAQNQIDFDQSMNPLEKWGTICESDVIPLLKYEPRSYMIRQYETNTVNKKHQ